MTGTLCTLIVLIATVVWLIGSLMQPREQDLIDTRRRIELARTRQVRQQAEAQINVVTRDAILQMGCIAAGFDHRLPAKSHNRNPT